MLDFGSVTVTLGLDEMGTATETFFFLRGRCREEEGEEEDMVGRREKSFGTARVVARNGKARWEHELGAGHVLSGRVVSLLQEHDLARIKNCMALCK